MILGIGTDIIQVSRIKRVLDLHNERFLMRLFTPIEQLIILRHNKPEAFCAKRFAAKEAFVKALGTGISDGVYWNKIEIIKDSYGAPGIRIIGAPLKILNLKKPRGSKIYFHLTLSDTIEYAQAVVIIEARF